MCIIVYNKTGKELDKAQMKIAYENNPHGFGLMWYDGDCKRVRTLKEHDTSFESMWEALENLSGVTYALHLRWRTRGADSLSQCHPHKITSKDEGAPDDVFLMHNGTLPGFTAHKKHSDTKLFAKKLSVIMRGTQYEFEKSLGRMRPHVSKPNRLLFMHSSGKVTIVNGAQGTWTDGIWYSNTYSFEKGYRKPFEDSCWQEWYSRGGRSVSSSAKPSAQSSESYEGPAPYWKDPSKPKVYRGLALSRPSYSSLGSTAAEDDAEVIWPTASSKYSSSRKKRSWKHKSRGKKAKQKQAQVAAKALPPQGSPTASAAPRAGLPVGRHTDGRGNVTIVTKSGKVIKVR